MIVIFCSQKIFHRDEKLLNNRLGSDFSFIFKAGFVSAFFILRPLILNMDSTAQLDLSSIYVFQHPKNREIKHSDVLGLMVLKSKCFRENSVRGRRLIVPQGTLWSGGVGDIQNTTS